MQGPYWISLCVFKFCLAKVVLFNHTCILDSLQCFHHSDTFAIYINLQSTSHWIILHPTPPTTFWGIMLSCSVISRLLYSKQDFAHIWTTRSGAALRAADLGLSGQDAFAQWHSFDPKKRHVTNTGSNRMRKWSFFFTHVGSQLTFMTQDEKVIIIRYPRGVTTDLLDV